jgi:hypothetical protein
MLITAEPLEDTRKLTLQLALRELGLSLGLLLICLWGFEAVLRSEFAYERLPLARAYYSFDVTRRLHDLEQLEEQGPVDVLFLGSSVVRAGLDPDQFDAVLKKKGRRMRSFNGAFSSMFSPAAKLYLQHVWLDAARPRFVLHGVREAELALGTREPAQLSRGLIESLWLEDNSWSLFKASLLQHVHLTHYRGTLRKLIERYRDGQPFQQRERGELKTGPRGFREERTPLAKKRKTGSKRLWKYRTQPEENRYRNSLPALEAMRQICADAGATYVLVNMPEHPDRYGSAEGPALFQDYIHRIRRWAEQHDVPFIDVTDGDMRAFRNDHYYSDFHHLSPLGAKRLSTLVAERFAGMFPERATR